MSCNTAGVVTATGIATFKPCIRMSCNPSKSINPAMTCFLQAMHTHELQQQKCTMHWLMHGLLCAYLNLFECLASPKEMGLTATFSISGREVAPDFCAKQQEKPVHSVFARVAFAIILSIPFVEIFREAFRSAFALKPQAVQQKRAWLGRFLASMFPHLLHRWEV